MHVTREGEDPILLVLAVDHLIDITSIFQAAIKNIIPFADLSADDLVIVNTKDALLVSVKSNVQDVKFVVEYPKFQSRSWHQEHTIRYFPRSMLTPSYKM